MDRPPPSDRVDEAWPERAGAGVRSVVGMVSSRTGAGYWQAAASGEVLAFGDAPLLGNPASLSQPIVGMAAVPAADRPIDGGGVVLPFVEPTTTTTRPWLGPPQYFANAANATWGTSVSTLESGQAGRVLALAEAGDKIFVGGEFAGAAVPPPAGDGDPRCKPGMTPLPPAETCVLRPFLFALDRTTGALLDWDAQPDGAVLSLKASPDGKQLYAGGRFTRIGGGPAGRLALLDVATATQVTSFKPPKVDSSVRALALHGDTLYFGGSFRRLDVGTDGQPVVIPQPAQVAAVDAGTGALRTGWPLAENTGGRFVGQTGTPTEDGVPGVVCTVREGAEPEWVFSLDRSLDLDDAAVKGWATEAFEAVKAERAALGEDDIPPGTSASKGTSDPECAHENADWEKVGKQERLVLVCEECGEHLDPADYDDAKD